MRLFGGRFEILERLGEGAMATVELARDAETDALVALKRLLPERAGQGIERAMFLRESEVLGRLDGSRGVPRFVAAGEVEDGPWFAMEYVAGECLSERLDGGALDWRDATTLVAQAALRVDGIHRAGYVHRDLKPSNLLADLGGRIWILDFGIAVPAHSPAAPEEAEFVLGTPSFIAPERVSSAVDPRDPRSDVYSLGIVLYELATGRLPFEGGSASQILARAERLTARPLHELVPRLPQALSEAARHAMAKDPAERFPTAGDLAAALLGILRTDGAVGSAAA